MENTIDLTGLTASTQMVARELISRGHSITRLPATNGFMVLAPNTGKQTLFMYTATPFNDQGISTLSRNKLLTKQLAAQQGVMTPDYVYLAKKDTLEGCRAELETLLTKGPVILKPNKGSESKGVRMNITNWAQLETAYADVRPTTKQLLIEQQVAGDTYRLLFVDGTLIAVVRRQPFYVLGNGIDTIQILADSKSAEHIQDGTTSLKITLDETVIGHLQHRYNYTPDTIPRQDEIVSLYDTMEHHEIITSVDVNTVSAKLLESLKKFTSQFNFKIVGIDMLSSDISNYEVSYFLETNTKPVYSVHHHPDYGDPVAVEKYIVDLFEKTYGKL